MVATDCSGGSVLLRDFSGVPRTTPASWGGGMDHHGCYWLYGPNSGPNSSNADRSNKRDAKPRRPSNVKQLRSKHISLLERLWVLVGATSAFALLLDKWL